MRTKLFKTHIRPASALLVAGLALALGGCVTDTDYPGPRAAFAPIKPSEKFPISVSETSVSVEVPVHKRMSRLPADVRADVQNFLHQYHSSGSGHLAVITPRRARYSTSMSVALAELRSMIKSAGINPNAVLYAHYPKGAAGTTAPITLSFQGTVAIPPECGHWPHNLAANYHNRTYDNFGCAHQANQAAMIANPNDLVAPRTMTPSHAGRRDAVIESYRLGDATEADTSASNDNGVSEVGNE